jgi:hypothetical protein
VNVVSDVDAIALDERPATAESLTEDFSASLR